MRVVFRVDASLQIGTGHIIRCLTLAEALRSKCVNVEFICRKHTGNLIDYVKKKGFQVYELQSQNDAKNNHYLTKEINEKQNQLFHSSWLAVSQNEDAKDCIQVLQKIKVDWLIVDHYGIDKEWQTTLSKYYNKLMVIDDLADRKHDCDLLLDQNLTMNMKTRYKKKLPKKCKQLIGPKYALLQPIYSELHNDVKYRKGLVNRIIIYFGGIDTDNLTGRLLSVIIGFIKTDVVLDVVVSSKNPNLSFIQKLVKNQNNISLHIDLPSLAPLMIKADLAIGASGTTSLERLCLGLPSLVFTIAENQSYSSAELEKRGLIRRLKNNNFGVEFLQVLSEILENNLDQNWSINCHKTVDGGGVERVCSMLEVSV